MKTKAILLGLTFFFIGMVVTFGIQSNTRHHNFKHEAGISKRTSIEVGAPLSVKQLKELHFI